MFETDVVDEGIVARFINWFGNTFFPVNIAKRKDYLIIEDRRVNGSVYIPLGGAAVLMLLLMQFTPSYINFFLELIGAALISILIVFGILIFISSLAKRTLVFYKEKDSYEIINKGIFRTTTETGYISEIKEIKLITRRYEDGDGNESYTYTSQIIPKNMILDDLRIQSLEKETIFNNYETTARIVYEITDFLNVPFTDEEIG